MRRLFRRAAARGRARTVLALLLAVLICLPPFPAEAFAAPSGEDGTDLFLVDSPSGEGRIGALMARAGAADGYQVAYSWSDDPNVRSEDKDGLRTWYASETALRNFSVGVQVNVNVSKPMAAGAIRITLPYRLEGVYRSDAGAEAPACSVSGAGWKSEIDEENNLVVVTNSGTMTAGGGHSTFGAEYKLDCWSTVSDKEFDIECVTQAGDGEPETTVLRGAVHTDFDVKFGGYRVFNGFGGAEYGNKYVRQWSKVYETYFGLTKDQYDADVAADWVYDIASYMVIPTGQQPYDIKGTFTPGNPSANEWSANGWSAELVGGVYMHSPQIDAAKWQPLEIVSAEDVKPDGSSHTWTAYDFRLGHETLPVVTTFSNGSFDSNDYILYFLVRYKLDDGSVGSSASGTVSLRSKIDISHVGLDSKVEKTCSDSLTGYTGTVDHVSYAGSVYGAAYNEERSTTESDSGLSALLSGRPAALDLVADFVCANENRSGEPIDDPMSAEPHVLEGIIDLSFMSDGAGGSATMLEDGGSPDYRLTYYSLGIADAYGSAIPESDGTWSIGWADQDFDISPWITSDDLLYVYGSSELAETGDNWELLDTIPVSKAWFDDWHLTENKGNSSGLTRYNIGRDDIVRLKVVYKNSRLTTVLRVRYGIELLPGGSNLSQVLDRADRAGSESIELTGWLNYTAYSSAEYGKYPDGNPVPDLVSEYGGVKDEYTGGYARQYDRTNAYPGYASSDTEPAADAKPYPYRNFIKATLGRSDDAAGMTVLQVLYGGDGKPLGSVDSGDSGTNKMATTYSQVKDVSHLGKVVYAVDGVVTNYSRSGGDLKSRRAADEGSNTPYTAAKIRYYALLPEGLVYKDNSLSSWENGNCRDVYNGYGNLKITSTTLPGISMTATGQYNGQGVTNIYWKPYGSCSLVDTVWIGNRQLIVADRVLSTDLDDDEETEIKTGSFSNNPDHPTYYVWGQGISFTAEPADPDAVLPSGSYETLFMSQFLDADGNPVSMDYAGSISSDAAGAFGEAVGALIDPYLDPGGGSTFTSISAGFRNRSGSGNSYAEVRAKNGTGTDLGEYAADAAAEPETGTYSYALTYSVDDGQSRDVVLWDSIESYGRSGHDGETVASDWKGVLTGVDLNGTGASVWVSEDAIDIDGYVEGGAGKGWLDEGRGWHRIDPDAYDQWDGVKSIAFSFDDTTFDASKPDGSSATVFLRMKVPETVDTAAGRTVYTAYNEIMFSDVHAAGGAGIAVTNAAKVVMSLEPDVPLQEFELPRTGGAGVRPFVACGSVLAVAGLILLACGRKRRHA